MPQQLLSPIQVGRTTLANRVVMAPLTRSRAGQPGDVPTELNVTYYAPVSYTHLRAHETS